MLTAAVIGGGVIGSGWAARFLLQGWRVQFFDPSPNAQEVLTVVLERARETMPELYDQMPAEGDLVIAASIAEAVAGADWVQESTPERLPIKQAVLAEIQAACSSDAPLVLSSDSKPLKYIFPSRLRATAMRLPSSSARCATGLH